MQLARRVLCLGETSRFSEVDREGPESFDLDLFKLWIINCFRLIDALD